jgi:polysaccharide pyruvyl transferase WcaK-like protein
MRVTIVGWYGTETIGDRAILAGLLAVLSDSFGSIDISLGSLYPFFTRRTVMEDSGFWAEICDSNVEVSIFDSSRPSELSKAIRGSELVVMGGGPLMQLNELFMVEYAFRSAKRNGIKTAILGCGIGPIFDRKYYKPLLNIIGQSDLVVLRDSISESELALIRTVGKNNVRTEARVALDPSVIACAHYVSELHAGLHALQDERVCINLRSFPSGYSGQQNIKENVNAKLVDYVRRCALELEGSEILLVPMHYFHIGDDDRYFLSRVRRTVDLPNISVQHEPLSLKETLRLYAGAKLNVGMRFHAVVFQTVVSGRNFILDYTQPGKGKIAGFLRDVDPRDFYKDRYFNLQSNMELRHPTSSVADKFLMDPEALRDVKESYVNAVCSIL